MVVVLCSCSDRLVSPNLLATKGGVAGDSLAWPLHLSPQAARLPHTHPREAFCPCTVQGAIGIAISARLLCVQVRLDLCRLCVWRVGLCVQRCVQLTLRRAVASCFLLLYSSLA